MNNYYFIYMTNNLNYYYKLNNLHRMVYNNLNHCRILKYTNLYKYLINYYIMNNYYFIYMINNLHYYYKFNNLHRMVYNKLIHCSNQYYCIQCNFKNHIHNYCRINHIFNNIQHFIINHCSNKDLTYIVYNYFHHIRMFNNSCYIHDKSITILRNIIQSNNSMNNYHQLLFYMDIFL